MSRRFRKQTVVSRRQSEKPVPDAGHEQRINQKGSALIITLLLITILAGLVVDFVYEVYIDSSALSNWGNAQRASFLARSGQRISTKFIKEINEETYTDRREVAFPLPLVMGTGVDLLVRIEDENAKLNVNNIIQDNGLTNEKALTSLKKLLEYLNINPSLALSIADWIDPDSEPRSFDSENYAKNSFLWSVEELKFLEGMDNESFRKIRPYITVHGNGRININTAELPVLVCLDSDMTETLAAQIIDYRKTTPFETIGAITNVSGLEAIGIKILDTLTVKASSFRVTARAEVNEIIRIVESVMDSSMKIQFWREG